VGKLFLFNRNHGIFGEVAESINVHYLL
jgi:hypothetical protein